MKTKHTEGEWNVIQPKYQDYLVVKSDYKDLHICEILKGTYTIDKQEAEANAKLIAAAPELLEALKELMDLFYDHEPELYRQRQFNKAIKAINKATL